MIFYIHLLFHLFSSYGKSGIINPCIPHSLHLSKKFVDVICVNWINVSLKILMVPRLHLLYLFNASKQFIGCTSICQRSLICLLNNRAFCNWIGKMVFRFQLNLPLLFSISLMIFLVCI